ncbi:MAG: cysteine peptidase family C39 domain-containing protein [Limnobacter sp.]|nr:cysteine peptidase family C39 domain-containing protein [Limnobacter sp.]
MKTIFYSLALFLSVGCTHLTEPVPKVELEPLSTWHDWRFRNMIPQELDMSCGAATMASMVSFYGETPLSEAELLDMLTQTVPAEQQDRVLSEGFSLLHMKRALHFIDLDLKAARITHEQLEAFASPAMLQLKTEQGYHFVLWHGKVAGLHWIGDPSVGDVWWSDKALSVHWTGIAAWVFKQDKPLKQARIEQLNQALRLR